MKGCNGKTTISGWFSLSHWVIDIWHVPLYLDQLAGSFHRTRSSFKAPDLWVKRPRAMRRSHHWSINWSMNEPIRSNPIRSNPIHHSISRSNQSVNWSIQSFNQLTNQSIDQWINVQWINEFSTYTCTWYIHIESGEGSYLRLMLDWKMTWSQSWVQFTPWQRNIKKHVANELRQAWPDQKVTSIQERRKKHGRNVLQKVFVQRFPVNTSLQWGLFSPQHLHCERTQRKKMGGWWNCFGVWVY